MTKVIFPSLFLFLIILLVTTISCSIKSEINFNKPINENREGNNLIREKKQTMPKQKVSKRFRLKTEKDDLDEIDEDKFNNYEDDDKNLIQQKQTDSIFYVSWFIFVPLVLLIFIMTILSIAGFLILIINSTGSHNHQRSFIPNAGNRLNNSEILEILRYKLHLKKKMKNNKNLYKPEPEPEGIILKS
jgi:hypothetical protein